MKEYRLVVHMTNYIHTYPWTDNREEVIKTHEAIVARMSQDGGVVLIAPDDSRVSFNGQYIVGADLEIRETKAD